MQRQIIVSILLTAAVMVAVSGSGCIDRDSDAVKLQIAGSTTVLPIGEECARIFMKEHPGSRIDVSGGGSSHGIRAVAAGTVDIGCASRDLKPSELKIYPDLVLHAIARDGIAVIVHPENPVSSLTLAQVQGIYAGTITNWKEVGGTDSSITVVSREKGSGTRECFEQAVMVPISEEVTDRAIIQDSNGKVRATIAGNEYSIGFISIGYLNSEVKSCYLDGIEPTPENVVSGRYMISRTLWMVTNGEPDADEQAFLDFVLGDEGQKIVETVGYLPVELLQA